MNGRRSSRAFTVALAAVLAGGCAGGAREDVPAPVAGAWTAEISGSGEEPVNGFATITILATGETRVNATLTDATPEVQYPWALWSGACGEDGERVGGAEDYPVMRSNDRGNASATATLPLTLPVEQNHRIEVYAEDRSAVVGCGDLR